MTTEPESTQPAAPAAFKRTELQRFPSPIPGFEIIQTLAEIPEGVASGRHIHPGGPEVGYIVRGDVAMEFEDRPRSEEHTSELQSRQYLVCRLLLEKKKNQTKSVQAGKEN